MDDPDGHDSQLDAVFAAFRSLEEDEEGGNIYVHHEDADPEGVGKVFYEVPPEVAGRIRMIGGFDPNMTFVDCLRKVVAKADGEEV